MATKTKTKGAPTAEDEEPPLPSGGSTPLLPALADPLPPTVKVRVCKEHDRAPKGFVRYYCHCANSESPYLYILAAEAATKEDVRACYLKESEVAATIKGRSGKGEQPEPVVTLHQLDD